MLNLGTPELLVILVVALLVLGPTRLPDAARQVGKAMGEVRRVADGFQRELTAAASAEPVPATVPVRPARRTPLRADPEA